MATNQFLPATYLFNVSSAIILIVFKLNHISANEWLFDAAVLSQLLYAIPCMLEVRRSVRISRGEKTTWIIGLLCATIIAGGVYIFSARKRIANIEAS
jgi:hypothetical protein